MTSNTLGDPSPFLANPNPANALVFCRGDDERWPSIATWLDGQERRIPIR
jgi:hypothetical protein